MLEQLENIESQEESVIDELGEGEDEEEPLTVSMTSYGADFPVDGLVKRMKENERGRRNIKVPDFQRGFVWDHKRSIRFIESLLLDMPVPGIFLSLERNNDFLVVDGQQRLKTLQFFYDGKFDDNQPFVLRNVNSDLDGKTYNLLEDKYKDKLDNTLIHATIIKQDRDASDENLYRIFDRLNSGGIQLLPQEVRTAASYGALNKLLVSLNTNQQWRSIFGKVNSRGKDQELILRFFALYFDIEHYQRPMKSFLDNYMRENRQLKKEGQSASVLTQLFENTIKIIHNCIGTGAFKPYNGFNAAIFDAVMVGVARHLQRGEIIHCNSFIQQYDNLIKNTDFIVASESGTASNASVQNRIKLATDAFANLKWGILPLPVNNKR